MSQRRKPLVLTLTFSQEIKKPMDLGTIRKKLSRRQYLSPESFMSDVRLVWSNAWTYNRPGDDIYVMAEKLSERFEELVSSKPILRADSEVSSAKKALDATALVGLNAEGWREYGFLNHTEGRIRRQTAWDAAAKARMEADRALTGLSGYDVSHSPPVSLIFAVAGAIFCLGCVCHAAGFVGCGCSMSFR